MSTAKINLVAGQYVRINSALNDLIVEAREGEVLVAITNNQPAPTNSAFHRLRDGERLVLTGLDENVWAYTSFQGAKAVVTELEVNLLSDFGLSVAAGIIDGADDFSKFGAIGQAPLNTEVDVWTTGGLYQFQTTADTLDVASDDGGDTSAGAGARTVEIFGLDANYTEISEVVTLNGLTPVTTTQSFLRANRMIVRTAGVNGEAIGTITASATGTGDPQVSVVNGFNQSLAAIYTVPAGKALILKGLTTSIGKNKEGLFEFKLRPEGEVFQVKRVFKNYQSVSHIPGTVARYIDEKTDVKVSVISDTANAFCSAEFTGILIDKTKYGIA